MRRSLTGRGATQPEAAKSGQHSCSRKITSAAGGAHCHPRQCCSTRLKASSDAAARSFPSRELVVRLLPYSTGYLSTFHQGLDDWGQPKRDSPAAQRLLAHLQAVPKTTGSTGSGAANDQLGAKGGPLKAQRKLQPRRRRQCAGNGVGRASGT